MTVQSNATLTKVRNQGSTDEWDDSESLADPELWVGALDVYYREKRELAGGPTPDYLVRRTLLVDEGQPPGVEWNRDLVVEFTFAGTARTATVRDVERFKWAPAGLVQSTRLTMEET